jgi:hypothetical protein
MTVSAHCVAVLREPYSQELCYDFKRVRARVMCLAWTKMEERKISFKQAINEAWAEVKGACREQAGAYI